MNIPISSFLSDNENYLKQTVGLGVTYDVGIRKFQILNKEIGVLFVNGLCGYELYYPYFRRSGGYK